MVRAISPASTVRDMDLQELLSNIETARDAAREDAEAFKREVNELKGSQRVGAVMGAAMA